MTGQRRVLVDTSPEPALNSQQIQQKSQLTLHQHLNQTAFLNNTATNKVNTSSLSAKPSTSRPTSGLAVTLKPASNGGGQTNSNQLQ